MGSFHSNKVHDKICYGSQLASVSQRPKFYNDFVFAHKTFLHFWFFRTPVSTTYFLMKYNFLSVGYCAW